MNHAIFVNFMICFVTLAAIEILKEPLALVGLLALRELPYDLEVARLQIEAGIALNNGEENEAEEGEYDSKRGFGFAHH